MGKIEGNMVKTTTRILLLGATFALGLGCKSEEATKSSPAEVAQATAALEKAAAPSDIIYAASSHVRVADVARGEVIQNLDLQKAVRAIVFSADGRTAFVAASDGVRSYDAENHRFRAKLTDRPARNVELDETGTRLLVLDHNVIVHDNDVREIEPFGLVTIDVATEKVLSREIIGQRILYARRLSAEGSFHVVVTEAGEVRLGRPGQPLSDGEVLDARSISGTEELIRLRHEAVAFGAQVYLPMEGYPSAVIELDLTTGHLRSMSLDRPLAIRGLAVTPDGQYLLVNAGKEMTMMSLATGTVGAVTEIDVPGMGLTVSSDGRFAYAAETIAGTRPGGSVIVVSLDPFEQKSSVPLHDISPWAIAVRPQTD